MASKGGFSGVFNELIDEQGEGAFIIEGGENDWKITEYTLPRERREFKQEEIRNAYLAQAMINPEFEDSERALLTEYLEDHADLSGKTDQRDEHG